MMKNYLQRSVLFFLLMTFSGLLTAQTNLLPSDFFGFENQDPDGWWINAESSLYVSILDEQAATGMYSLKFNFDDYGTLSDGNTTVAAESVVADGAKVDLTAGTYYMKVKVYIEDNPPSILKTIFTEDWIQVDWDLSEVETGKWVTLMQTVSFSNDVVEDQLVVQVFKNTFTGMEGSGAFYVDDIEIFESVDLSDPETPMDDNHFSFEDGDGSWWIQSAHREYAEINYSEAASGFFSMQYSYEDYSADPPNVLSTSNATDGLIELQEGKFYEVKLKIFMEDVTDAAFPSGFETNIKGDGGSGFQNINWDLEGVSQRGEWVEKTQTIEYTGSNLSAGQIVERLLVIKINSGDLPASGSGTFYVDDISFMETEPTFLPDIDEQTVRVYPNPATDVIYLNDLKGSRVSLFNVSGALVKTFVAKSDLDRISVSGFTSGVYILKVEGDQDKFVEKITIK